MKKNILLVMTLAWAGTSVGLGAAITWIGAGDGISWADTNNWAGGVNPGLADDVVITSGVGTNVVISSGTISVKSVQCSRAFTISGGSLTVTDGASLLTDVLSVASGRLLSVSGSTTTFSCTGPVTADGARFAVADGARLSLPGLGTYTKPSSVNADWQVTGAGSVLDFPGLTNLNSSISGGYSVYASGGGQVLLTNLANIIGGGVLLDASGAGSLLDLSRLFGLSSSSSRYYSVSAGDGGTILLNTNTDLFWTNVGVSLSAGGAMTTARIVGLQGVWIDKVNANFPSLTNVAVGGSIILNGTNAAFAAPLLTNIDGVALDVSGGAVLSLLGVRSYAVLSGPSYRANGAGSRIVLASLTNMIFSDWGMYLSASSGGRVELGALQGLGACYLEVQANGSGSVVDLSSVASMDTVNGYVAVTVQNNGAVLLPQLVDGAMVRLTLRSGGTVPTGQWARLLSLTLDGVVANFPALTNVVANQKIALANGAVLTAPLLAAIDGVTLEVNGGSVLELPGVRSYAKPGGNSAYFRAADAGSRIVLPNLTNLVSSSSSAMGLYAYAGGRVELGALTSLGSGQYGVVADGSGSVIDLSAVTSLDAGSGDVGVTASNGGAVLLPWLADGQRVNLSISSGGVIQTAQWFRLRSLTLDGVVATFPALTNFGNSLSLANLAALSMPLLTNIDGAALDVSGGSVLSLPRVRSYASLFQNSGFGASGAGSRIVLPNLTNMTSGGWGMSLSAYSGGRVELGALQGLDSDMSVIVMANGSGSVVDLSAVASMDTVNGYLEVTAQSNGTVLLPQLVDGAMVQLTMRSGGTVPTGQWTRLWRLTLDGVVTNFPALTNVVEGGIITLANGAVLTAPLLAAIDHVNLFASGGSALSLPAVQSYNTGTLRASSGGQIVLTNLVSCGGGTLSATADGSGSFVGFSGLTNLSVSAGKVFSATANGGGSLDLHRLESISGGSARFLSDGTGSLIDLSNLSGFITPLGASSLVAQNGGVILMNSTAVFLLANVAVTLPGVIAELSPAMVLHGLAWQSYWVEQRDTRNAANPWQFLARVPQTNEFQTFASAPRPDAAFRVWEFTADPPILDLWRQADGQVQLVLYGATNKTYAVQSTNSLPNIAGDWPEMATASMTNSFRIFPPVPAIESSRFYRGRQM
jgi:hypothetical protein